MHLGKNSQNRTSSSGTDNVYIKWYPFFFPGANWKSKFRVSAKVINYSTYGEVQNILEISQILLSLVIILIILFVKTRLAYFCS